MTKTETATFAMGCFWEPDDFFSRQEGVLKTTVGYAGGTKKDPTYHDLDDHTETVEIQFDPSKITYEKLLSLFWEKHNSTVPQSVQYKSIIFFHSPEQKKTAEKTLKEQQKMHDDKILTEIKPASKFYRAEEYHQKYLQKHKIQKMLFGT